MAVEPVVRPHRIELKLSSGTRYEEGFASESGIYPGMLLEKLPGTGSPFAEEHDLRKHSVQGGRGELIIPLEDALQGKTIVDAFAVGDVIGYRLALPGDEFQLYVENGASLSKGTKLTSAGNGQFEITASNDEVIAEVLEVRTTGSGANHVRCRITPQARTP